MPRIPIPISKADLEHYECRLVLVTAQALAKVDNTAWERLAQKTRSRWIERALDLVAEVLADRGVVERLPVLAKSLTWRVKDQRSSQKETPECVFQYRGRVYVSPCSRGWTLSDLKPERGLEEILEEGDYEVELRVIRRPPHRR